MRNSTTGEEVLGTATLDTGAKLTYITAEKAKPLGLKFGSSRVMHVKYIREYESNRGDN